MGKPAFNINPQLKPLTLRDLRSQGHHPAHLWFLLREGEITGPYSTQDLKNYLQVFPEGLSSQTMLCNLEDEDNFKPLVFFENFKLSKVASKIEKEYYLLQRGQKTGPFSSLILKDELKKQNILYTDLISCDQGKTWQKVFETSDFNRREHKTSNVLPHVFTSSETPKTIKPKLPDDDVTQVLAFLSHPERKKEKSPISIQPIVVKKKRMSLLLWIIPILTAGVYYKFFNEEKKEDLLIEVTSPPKQLVVNAPKKKKEEHLIKNKISENKIQTKPSVGIFQRLPASPIFENKAHEPEDLQTPPKPVLKVQQPKESLDTPATDITEPVKTTVENDQGDIDIVDEGELFPKQENNHNRPKPRPRESFRRGDSLDENRQ